MCSESSGPLKVTPPESSGPQGLLKRTLPKERAQNCAPEVKNRMNVMYYTADSFMSYRRFNLHQHIRQREHRHHWAWETVKNSGKLRCLSGYLISPGTMTHRCHGCRLSLSKGFSVMCLVQPLGLEINSEIPLRPLPDRSKCITPFPPYVIKEIRYSQ